MSTKSISKEKELSLFEELSAAELESNSGGKMNKKTCDYTLLMCVAMPWGCTSPCEVWGANCRSK